MNNYYIPDISEFHIGFEYQTYMMSNGGFIIMDMKNFEYSTVKEPDNHMWFTTTFRLSEKGPLDTPYTLEQIKDYIKEGRVRVKYVDEEDLKELGFTETEEKDPFSGKNVFRRKDEPYFNTGVILTIAHYLKGNILLKYESYGSYGGTKGEIQINVKNKTNLKKILGELRLG